MRSLKCLKKNKKGFTLVELVVVLAIMAVLAGVITPSLSVASKNRTREKYKNYCVSILDSAEAIAEAYNKGANSIAGYKIVNTRGEIDWTNVQECLKVDNTYNYQCDIVIFREGFPGGLKESGNSINNVFANKDTVVVCYKKTQKGELFASGCWYFEKGQKTTEYKFDYGKNTFIASDEVFYTPDK